MADKAIISSIKLPSGTEYDLVDSGVRSLYSTLNSKVDAFTGVNAVVCSQASDTPSGVSWTNSSNTTITGTLAASSSTKNNIYLVKSGDTTNDTYVEYISVLDSAGSTTYKWEIIGKTSVDLSGYQKKITSATAPAPAATSTDVVLGEGTTFTNGTSAVSFTKGTDYNTKAALGASATFSASGTAVSFASPKTSTVLKSTVTGTVPKVVSTGTGSALSSSTTATIGGNILTSGTTKYLSASAGNPTITPTKDVTLKKTSIKGVKSTVSVLSSVDSEGDVGTLTSYSFTVSDGLLTISGSNGKLPTFPTYNTETVAIAEDSAVSNVIISDSTIGDSGVGIMTGASASAPSITLSENTTTSTGAIEYIKSVSKTTDKTVTLTDNSPVTAITGVGASSSETLDITLDTTGNTASAITALGTASITNPTISVSSKDSLDAVISLSGGTAAAQKITVGTNDKVTAVTGVGTGSGTVNVTITP